MPIVTFTSDFGGRDYYAALIKGAMLSENAALNIVDITHEVPPYDIVAAAFALRNVWRAFPKGSIHLVSVHDYAGGQCRFLALHRDGHFFVGPDNGVFSLVFDILPDEAYHLPFDPDDDSAFPLMALYARAVGHLSRGLPLSGVGVPAEAVEKRIALQPVITHSRIRGSVTHLDRYGNAVTNIHRDLFERVGAGRHFTLHFKRFDPITTLCRHYHDVPLGETLCFFNSAGYAEIAIHAGRAADLLGLKVEDTVEINFTSSETR